MKAPSHQDFVQYFQQRQNPKKTLISKPNALKSSTSNSLTHAENSKPPHVTVISENQATAERARSEILEQSQPQQTALPIKRIAKSVKGTPRRKSKLSTSDLRAKLSHIKSSKKKWQQKKK